MEKPGFVAPTSKSIVVSAPGAAPLDPPEAETALPEVVAKSKSTGMTLCSQSRENRSKITVREDIHSESTGFAFCTRPEPEAARRETVNAPVAGASFGDIAAASSRNQSVESGSEAGVKPQSGYPLPARQHGSRFRTAHASAI